MSGTDAPASRPGEVLQPRIRLDDGTIMPQLGLGVWRTPAGETADIVRHAVAAGYLAVDTAAIYGNEEGVGDGLSDRPDIHVTTKLWNDDQGYDATLRACDASLRKLRRETLDLYLIHWPKPAMGRFVETWKAMVALRQDGRVKSIGVSNFRAEDLDRIIGETGVVPAVNQIELHPYFQQHALRAYNEKHGIRTESWSPLGQGQVLADPAIGEIARKHGKTPAQVIIRWHLDSGLIVIPKSATPKRIDENIAVFDFALEAEDMRRIAGLDRPDGRIGPDPAAF
ncbi:aldo/keto reductase [Gluconacetobacter takamatsuzukensis]|uniref:Aldo/keto reductase n=1 Tax=Gluconacetobacter takamatsuzukensis TaxID=1286190 RepID=A0A7W4KEG2_9PROT|nr:aldo/keto reductase [Gluconacetobacter takamatsuzukensis]MBB2205452.1 aldo/keto reductase [Gluconacetobacter takamatsuzukensis]